VSAECFVAFDIVKLRFFPEQVGPNRQTSPSKRLRRQGRDYAARDADNRTLAGELLVVEHEKRRGLDAAGLPELAAKVLHVADIKDEKPSRLLQTPMICSTK
jgi:hypothetical protein